MPYRTTDTKIDGAVITFVNFDDQKERELLLLRKVFDMNPDPLAVLDRDFKLVIANRAFSDLMELPEQEISGADIFSVKNEALELKELRNKLEKAMSKRENIVSETVTIPSRQRNQQYSINGEIVAQEEGDPYRILLFFKQNSV